MNWLKSMGLFRKNKVDEGIKILNEYIEEALKMGMSNEDIKSKLIKVYPEELIDKSLELNKKEVKMAKDEYEDDDYEEEFDEDEETDEEPAKKPIKKKRPTVPEIEPKKEDKPKITLDSVLTNHEQRILQLESAIFRLRSI
jgi:hypothetical protein